MITSERDKTRKLLERIAWLTDNSIPIPGTDARIGIDPLIGLVPWIGDALGAMVSSYIISEAARLGAPKTVLVKMTFNVGLDALIGIFPGVGDLFDFAWKANQRNVRLLEQFIEKPRHTVATSRLFVIMLALLLLGTVILIGIAGFWLVSALWQAVRGP